MEVKITTKVGMVDKDFQQDEGTSQSPSCDMLIIQSVPYRNRSFSRERTYLRIPKSYGVGERDIGSPALLAECRDDTAYSVRFSGWRCRWVLDANTL